MQASNVIVVFRVAGSLRPLIMSDGRRFGLHVELGVEWGHPDSEITPRGPAAEALVFNSGGCWPLGGRPGLGELPGARAAQGGADGPCGTREVSSSFICVINSSFMRCSLCQRSTIVFPSSVPQFGRSQA